MPVDVKLRNRPGETQSSPRPVAESTHCINQKSDPAIRDGARTTGRYDFETLCLTERFA